MGNVNVVRFFGSRRTCCECNLRTDCAWRDLDAEALDDLEAVPQLFRRGERLFHAGDRLRSLFVVRSGAVKTCLVSADGDEQIIGFHGPGELLALDAVADDRHACDAVALDTASVCTLSFEELSARAARRPGLQRHLLRCMSSAIKRSAEMVLMLGKKNAEQRMATFLLACADAQQRRGYSATEVTLSMSRADIGNHLSLAVETVCRLLTRLQAEGVLEVRRSAVSIRDPETLATLAGNDPEQNSQRAQGAL